MKDFKYKSLRFAYDAWQSAYEARILPVVIATGLVNVGLRVKSELISKKDES